MPSKLDHALALAAEGFWVFPILPWPLGSEKSKGKTPAVRFKEWATRDHAAIREWWSRDGTRTSEKYGEYHPADCNIGIFTSKFGDDQALFVADVDTKKGKDGNNALLAFELDGKSLPPTRETLTPTGGRHLIYCVDQPVKQGADVLGLGVDVRSHGGFVLAPGSTIDGKPYEAVCESPPAPAPGWAIEHCGRPREREEDTRAPLAPDTDHGIAAAIDYLANHAPRTDDPDAYKVAARVKDFGVGEATCLRLMQSIWDPLCDPPRSDNTAGPVHNAYRYGIDPPGVALPQADFSRVNPTYKGLAFKLFHEIKPDLLRPALVAGWLDREAFSVMYGPPGSAKSFNALHLAFCVATGTAWFGNKVEQGGVVYLALEGGAGVERRIEALRRHHGVTGKIPLAVCRGPVDLSAEGQGSMQPLYDMIREAGEAMGCKAGLLIVDTVARANAGGDENSSSDMGKFIAKLDRLRAEFGFHVLAIHHSGKDVDKGLRGSSALLGAVDTAILVLENVISVPDGEAGKQRDRGKGSKIGFKLVDITVGQDAAGELVTSAVVEAAPIESKVKAKPLSPKSQVMLQALHDAGGKSYDAWLAMARRQKLLSANPESARSQMNTASLELRTAGKITVKDDVVTVLE